MPLPKGFRKNIRLLKPKVGPERRQEILDNIDNQGTFLPRGVLYEDMDKAFIDMVEKDLEIVIDGEKVPVIFLTIQRWAEFSKTWQHSDKYKDITLPFITIVRKPDVQVGTNQAGNWNIPQGRRTYTYVKVPTWEGGRKGVDLYKIPQPTSVDVNYEVRLFCNKMRDLNKLHRVVQQTFQSRQHFINPNGHPMPVHLETVGDESPIDDFENRRFYVQLFEMKLLGYLLDEDKFEVVPAVNRALVVEEVSEGAIKPRIKITSDEETKLVNYSFIFKPRAESDVTITSEYDIKFTDVNNVIDITGIQIQVNGTPVSLPFVVTAGDSIFIDITKDFNKTGSFLLTGNLI
jgi:hypothetical protein